VGRYGGGAGGRLVESSSRRYPEKRQRKVRSRRRYPKRQVWRKIRAAGSRQSKRGGSSQAVAGRHMRSPGIVVNLCIQWCSIVAGRVNRNQSMKRYREPPPYRYICTYIGGSRRAVQAEV